MGQEARRAVEGSAREVCAGSTGAHRAHRGARRRVRDGGTDRRLPARTAGGLYERDLLPQEAILGWADRVEAEGDEGSEASRCLDKASSMIEWLRSEDDDDDDDESDDDEEE